ncbi:hypothetical protein GALL_69720 [mine drainage metagenome]|uniref:Uncharacterized protein n=1 Tax=mine drainage metagenome TaxID=410659 RepID=A0A1J5SSL8_9ZZZZ
MTQQTYVGVNEDKNGGLTHLGRMVRDAWVFGLLPETETCAGWDAARMQGLYEKVYAAWEPYAHLPSRLPEALRERHARFYAQAVTTARKEGWDPELGEDE